MDLPLHEDDERDYVEDVVRQLKVDESVQHFILIEAAAPIRCLYYRHHQPHYQRTISSR